MRPGVVYDGEPPLPGSPVEVPLTGNVLSEPETDVSVVGSDTSAVVVVVNDPLIPGIVCVVPGIVTITVGADVVPEGMADVTFVDGKLVDAEVMVDNVTGVTSAVVVIVEEPLGPTVVCVLPGTDITDETTGIEDEGVPPVPGKVVKEPLLGKVDVPIRRVVAGEVKVATPVVEVTFREELVGNLDNGRYCIVDTTVVYTPLV